MATSTAQTIATVPVWDYLMAPGDPTSRNPKGLSGKRVKVTLSYAQGQSASPVALLGTDPVNVQTDLNGFWQVNLIPNNKISPSGTIYTVEIEGYRSYVIQVPDVNAPAIGWQSAAIATLPPIGGGAPGYTLPGGTTVLGTFAALGEITAPDFNATGLVGAVAGTRYVGATAFGPPTAGTFVKGDFVIAIADSQVWVCQVAGTPGTWSAQQGVFYPESFGAKGDVQTVSDGVMNGVTGVLTSASGKFTALDVGKLIIVKTAGVAIANPNVAIIAADGGAGGTTLPVGAYTFAYTFIAWDGETTIGTSAAIYNQAVANHIISFTLPALPANVRAIRIYCTAQPGGAFTGRIVQTGKTTFNYTTGLTANQSNPPAANSAGAPISTTIASFQSPNQVTTTAASASNVAGATVIWGTDDQAAILAAYNAAVAVTKGTVALTKPGYMMSVGLVVNSPSINVIGSGAYSTSLYYTGAGDAVRVQMPAGPLFNFIWPGALRGFTIDGSGAAIGAAGLHYGDAVNGELTDFRVAYFRGTGSKNIWMDNRTNWTERIHWYKVNSYHGTTNILFDVNGGTTSFDHTFMIDVTMDVEQFGLVVNHGAVIGYDRCDMTGNCDGGGTVMQVINGSSFGFSGLRSATVITFECTDVATGLVIDATSFFYGEGVVDLGAGVFTSSNATGPNLRFFGVFNCPGIVAMSPNDAGVALGGMQLFAPPGNYRYPITAGDTGLVGVDLISNGVTWHIDHRGTFNGPNNLEVAQGGSGAYLRLTTGGLFGTLAQIYPGDVAGAQQASGGLLHAVGVPSNANGNNNDWCFSDNHHLYTRSGGVWIDMTAAVTAQSTPGNPAGTVSAVGVMMGLAGAITPLRTGSVLIIISGDIFNNTINDGATVQIRTGTGGAPVNGAALTGTARGGQPAATAAVGSEKSPFSVQAVVTGLTLGTAVWIDLAVAAVTGGTATVENISISAVEV